MTEVPRQNREAELNGEADVNRVLEVNRAELHGVKSNVQYLENQEQRKGGDDAATHHRHIYFTNPNLYAYTYLSSTDHPPSKSIYQTGEPSSVVIVTTGPSLVVDRRWKADTVPLRDGSPSHSDLPLQVLWTVPTIPGVSPHHATTTLL